MIGSEAAGMEIDGRGSACMAADGENIKKDRQPAIEQNKYFLDFFFFHRKILGSHLVSGSCGLFYGSACGLLIIMPQKCAYIT